MTVKVVKSKADVNQVVKKIAALFPESKLETSSFGIKLSLPDSTILLSGLKFRQGWSLLFNDTLINLNEN